MTTQSPSANPFEFWREVFQKSGQAWMDVASTAGPLGAPQISPFQSFNPFLASNPYQLWQQLWQQYLNTWSEYWTKNLSGTPSPDVFRAAEKQWMDQLESAAKAFTQAMSTEPFSQMLGKSIEQSLVWQDKFVKEINPQTDAALRAFNLPSRGQIDRLLERVIGLEERLDDAEDRDQQILRAVRSVTTKQEVVSPAPAAPKPSDVRGKRARGRK